MAAAYAALISLENIIHTLQFHPHPPISLPEEQRLLLTEKVTFLHEFLEGYNNLYDLDYTTEVDPLEIRIADAAYAAEDAIESHIVDHITIDDGAKMSSVKRGHLKNRFKNTINSFFKSCCSCTSPSSVPKMSSDADYAAEDAIESHIVDHITNDDGEKMMSSDALYQALDKLIEDMALIQKEAIQIKETTVAVQHQLPRKSTPSNFFRSSSFAHNSSMVGVDDIKLQLMDKLTDGRRDLQIIPIVGMGGTGKTTLAINIYQDRLIKEHYFDICGWATISQEYSIRDILIQFLRQLNQNVDQHSGEGVLGVQLHKHLFGRKYLIIMDDMWSIDAWDRVRNFFPNNKNGSRVVVTTRLSNLASELPGSERLEMGFLDEANSWNLLSKTVFGEKSCPPELKEIGKKIGKSCKGLPLSIVVVGGFLAKSKHTIEFWGYVEENLNSIVSLENDERCLKVINMSYKQLPIHLNPCFLYMGVYREDEEIRVPELIKLLAAEGFVKPRNGMSLEETAKEYLKDLIDRNLILVHKLGYCTGKIKYCKIHDLVREFCLMEARKERFYYKVRPNTPQGIMNGQRRIVINSRCALTKKKVVDSLRPMPLVRSCIWDLKNDEVPSLDDFRLLRVLHNTNIRELFSLPDAINSRNMTQLVNSRYLSLIMNFASFPIANRLPSSICRFWNLQTLLIHCNYVIVELPAEIWSMTQLRHIKSWMGNMHLPDPPASGEEDEMVLGNLETLDCVENFKCSEEVVKRIPNLRKLGLRKTEIRDSLSNLACLHKLESLDARGLKPSGDDDCVVNLNLNLPPSLKKLKLCTRLFKSWQDLWEEMGKLPLLERLLLDFSRCGEAFRELETVEGTFPRLKFLGICSYGHPEIWRMESSDFPCLECLYLFNVYNLEVSLAEIPTLVRIQVNGCTKSVGESAKRQVEIQEELYGESALQVLVEGEMDSDEEERESLASRNYFRIWCPCVY